jgi:hypothetical protein|tara:strand:+ start:6108 stop:6335 length:228 start_codon:yes stop_codon:yes gene_type:complete
MNARQKHIMHRHYTDLGWTNAEIRQYGTIDFTGKRPSDIERERVEAEAYQQRLREEHENAERLRAEEEAKAKKNK